MKQVPSNREVADAAVSILLSVIVLEAGGLLGLALIAGVVHLVRWLAS